MHQLEECGAQWAPGHGRPGGGSVRSDPGPRRSAGGAQSQACQWAVQAAVGPTGAGEQETQGAAHRIGVAESFQAWSRVSGRWPRQRAQEQVSQ